MIYVYGGVALVLVSIGLVVGWKLSKTRYVEKINNLNHKIHLDEETIKGLRISLQNYKNKAELLEFENKSLKERVKQEDKIDEMDEDEISDSLNDMFDDDRVRDNLPNSDSDDSGTS